MKNIESFLSNYDNEIKENALILNNLIISTLPDILVSVDLPAKMIAYSYGNKYIEMICAIFPSKKGIKLSFNRGILLSDNYKLLKGNGKITRYIEIKKIDNSTKSTIISYLQEANSLFAEATN